MGIFDTAKSLAELAQQVGKIELHKQAVEMMQQITEQQQQIAKLSDDLRSANDLLRIRGTTEFFSNACWVKVTEGNAVYYDGPYCSRCAQSLGKMIHLHFEGFANYMFPKPGDKIEVRYHCPECQIKQPDQSTKVLLTTEQRAKVRSLG
jgi:hypothetical protein